MARHLLRGDRLSRCFAQAEARRGARDPSHRPAAGELETGAVPSPGWGAGRRGDSAASFRARGDGARN
jgi:hypothetical protein